MPSAHWNLFKFKICIYKILCIVYEPENETQKMNYNCLLKYRIVSISSHSLITAKIKKSFMNWPFTSPKYSLCWSEVKSEIVIRLRSSVSPCHHTSEFWSLLNFVPQELNLQDFLQSKYNSAELSFEFLLLCSIRKSWGYMEHYKSRPIRWWNQNTHELCL